MELFLIALHYSTRVIGGIYNNIEGQIFLKDMTE